MGVATSELSELTVFEGCAPEDLEGVADAVTGVLHLAEGEVVCAEGDDADRWWIVVAGMADVTVRGLYTATIGPGESIGELALLDGEPRGATVTATTDMTLHEVDGRQFVEALLASPRLAVAMLREVASRLQERNRPPASAVAAGAAPPSPDPSPAVPRRRGLPHSSTRWRPASSTTRHGTWRCCGSRHRCTGPR